MTQTVTPAGMLLRATRAERAGMLLLSEPDETSIAIDRLQTAADMYGRAGNEAGVIRCLKWLLRIGVERREIPGGGSAVAADPPSQAPSRWVPPPGSRILLFDTPGNGLTFSNDGTWR